MSGRTVFDSGKFTREDQAHEANKALEAFPELAYSDEQIDAWIEGTATNLAGALVVLKRLTKFNLRVARVVSRLYLELYAKRTG